MRESTPSDPFGDKILARHFVAVVTEQYTDSHWVDLGPDENSGQKGLKGEVQELSQWLEDTESLGDRTFTRAFKDLGNNPTENEIEKAFKSGTGEDYWTSADAAVVFVSGHGESRENRHWLVLNKTERSRFKSSALETRRLLDWLCDSGIEHLVLIIDACFAGQVAIDTVDFEHEVPKSWLVLPSTSKDSNATTGVLTRAISQAVTMLRGGEGEKFGRTNLYFTVAEFVDTVQKFLPEDQKLVWQFHGEMTAPHACLPNPHYSRSKAVATTPPRRDLALSTDDLRSHWSPMGRGVATTEDTRWLFTGRTRLMRKLIDVSTGSHGTTLVTGPVGSGKSAALARLVTFSDPIFANTYRTQIEEISEDLRPPIDAVNIAVLATRKYPHEIIGQINSALRLDQRDGRGDLDAQIAACIEELIQHDKILTIVVDALDEAKDPIDIAHSLQAIQSGAPEKLRLIIGIRSPGGDHPSSSDLSGQSLVNWSLTAQISAILNADELRVDADEWWHQSDIADYVLTILRDTPGSVYQRAPHELSSKLAGVIASSVGRTFLVARLAANLLTEKPYPIAPDDPGWLATLSQGVVGVFRDDLRYVTESVSSPSSTNLSRNDAVTLLRAVAFAEGLGLPWGEIWPAVVNAVAGTRNRYGDRDIALLMRSRLSGYLVVDQDEDGTVYRLFHDALRTTLREEWRDLLDRESAGLASDGLDALSDHSAGESADSTTDEVEDIQLRITVALTLLINTEGLPSTYVRRHLVEHATSGRCLDGRVLTSNFLPFVDAGRLRRVLGKGQQQDNDAENQMRVFRRVTHRWSDVDAGANAAALEFWSAGMGYESPASTLTGWRVLWTNWQPGEAEVVGTHKTVQVVATLILPDRTPIAVSGGSDGTVRVWDLNTNQPHGAPLTGHHREVTALATLELPDHTPVALAGGSDGTVRVWDLNTNQPHCAPLTGHHRGVTALATLELPDRTPVALAGYRDGTVTVWDLNTNQPHGAPLTGHHRGVTALATLVLPDRTPVALAGYRDGTVTVWDLNTNQPHGAPLTGLSPTTAAATFELSAGTHVAFLGGRDGSVRMWNLRTNQLCGEILTGQGAVEAIATLLLPNGTPIVVTGRHGTVHMWDITSLDRHTILRHALANHGAEKILATLLLPDEKSIAITGRDDASMQVWDLNSVPLENASLVGQNHPSTAVATLLLTDGTPIAVAGGRRGTVQVWDLRTRQMHSAPLAGQGVVTAVATLLLQDGTPLAVTGRRDGTAQVWNLHSNKPHGPLLSGHGVVTAIATLHMPNGMPVAVIGGSDGTVRVWDLNTNQPHGAPLTGHHRGVTALATLVLPDRTPVALAGYRDGTVTVWDLNMRESFGTSWAAHSRSVTAIATLAIRGENPVAITGGREGALRVWDVTCGEPYDAPLPVPGPVIGLAVANSRAEILVLVAGHLTLLKIPEIR